VTHPDATADRAPLHHWITPMTGRDPHQPHRGATPLELLYDLVFVAAFGVAGNQMAHVLAEGHTWPAIGAFAFAMFATVWAWINYSWFASAFDTDDWFVRLTTMVQMVGVVVLALGLPDLFHSLSTGVGIDNDVIVAGYVVMRVAMLANWLRVARQAPQHRRVALTYVGYVAIAQVGWVTLLGLHLDLGPTVVVMVMLYVIEMGGPFAAERKAGGTPWHAHHIAERYGLLTIITLGEGVLGTIASVSPLIQEHGWTDDAIVLLSAGILLTFAIWWVYFMIPFGEILHRSPSAGFAFGYGHLPIVGALTAIGAGLHVAAYVVEGTAHIGYAAAVYAVAIPVGLFMIALFLVYGSMVRTLDTFHLALFAGVLAALALAVLLASAGVAFGLCVLLVAAAPVIVIVGFETIGHRHVIKHLDGLR
jgi:low temperature requirement protein LtrA